MTIGVQDMNERTRDGGKDACVTWSCHSRCMDGAIQGLFFLLSPPCLLSTHNLLLPPKHSVVPFIRRFARHPLLLHAQHTTTQSHARCNYNPMNPSHSAASSSSTPRRPDLKKKLVVVGDGAQVRLLLYPMSWVRVVAKVVAERHVYSSSTPRTGSQRYGRLIDINLTQLQ